MSASGPAPTEALFIQAVDDALAAFLDERRAVLAAVSADAEDLVDQVKTFTRGGKRVRSAFVLWGWSGVAAGAPDASPATCTPRDERWPEAVGLATAMELFHAAALVHDDIIDASDTRRGAPAVHKSFEAMHRDAEWVGDAEAFGRSAAILGGDILLAWADQLMLNVSRAAEHGGDVYDEYTRMREEVTFGQYLDVLEEVSWIRRDPSVLLDRARLVAIYKSARYSVMRPLTLGALLAGATDAQRKAFEGYGQNVGLAFQLRDDLLGVFGDPTVTGKPAGDDLREGKRTVLIELARERLSPGVRNLLDELLGDASLDATQIAVLQSAIRESGAVERVEALIDRFVGEGLESLRDGDIARSAVLELERLAIALARRDR